MRLDFRETAPAAASQDMYNDDIGGSIRGGLASGIPGDLRGLEYLHNKHGVSFFAFLDCILLKIVQVLPWRAVCNPAVHVARNGFRGTKTQAHISAHA